jgi:hypothetical protein
MISCAFPCAMLTPMMNLELVEDRKLDGKHSVEEAMSWLSFVSLVVPTHQYTLARALMRNCPKCQKGGRYIMFSAMFNLRAISSICEGIRCR